MITDHDMRNAVKATLGTYVDSFDVEAIVDDLQAAYGTVDTETIPPVEFWRIVERHDIENVPPHRAAAVKAASDPEIEPEEYAGQPCQWILYASVASDRIERAERQVTKAEWVAAERAAGFTGGRPGEPSTAGWGNGLIGGIIRPVTE